MQRASFYDIHHELSHLLHAAKKEFQDIYNVFCKLTYDEHVYLVLELTCYAKDQRKVVDRLQHGILHGRYDYRFLGIAYQTIYENTPYHERVWINATVDLKNSKRNA